MYQVTTKLEINVLDRNSNPVFAADFAQKHRCPAIVALPEMIAPLIANRAAKKGQYEIIAAIDFPYGKEFALNKFRSLSKDFIACNGFDIILTSGKTEIEARNEIKALYSFLRDINRTYNIRYVLGTHTRSDEDTIKSLKGMKQHPPIFIRLDQHLAIPNIDNKHHARMITMIHEHIPTPIKISGNVNLETIDMFSSSKNRFDVTVNQAVLILKELEKRNNPQLQAEPVTVA